MNNLQEEKVPYSAKAVSELLQLEQVHEVTKLSKGGYSYGWCNACRSIYEEAINSVSIKADNFVKCCPILIKARESSSRETIIAVALILNGENK